MALFLGKLKSAEPPGRRPVQGPLLGMPWTGHLTGKFKSVEPPGRWPVQGSLLGGPWMGYPTGAKPDEASTFRRS